MSDVVNKKITDIWVSIAIIHDRITKNEESIYTTLIRNWNDDNIPIYQIINILVTGGMSREKADQLVTKALGEED